MEHDDLNALERVANAIEKTASKAVTVKVSKEKRKVDVREDHAFVMLFLDNFVSAVDAHGLTLADLRVLHELCRITAFGNLLILNQKNLSIRLQISPSHLSRSMKKLRKADFIIETDDGIFLNPNVIAKGDLSKIDDDLLRAADETQHNTPFKQRVKVQKAIREKRGAI
jgi:hypothetical protein